MPRSSVRAVVRSRRSAEGRAGCGFLSAEDDRRSPDRCRLSPRHRLLRESGSDGFPSLRWRGIRPGGGFRAVCSRAGRAMLGAVWDAQLLGRMEDLSSFDLEVSLVADGLTFCDQYHGPGGRTHDGRSKDCGHDPAILGKGVGRRPGAGACDARPERCGSAHRGVDRGEWRDREELISSITSARLGSPGSLSGEPGIDGWMSSSWRSTGERIGPRLTRCADRDLSRRTTRHAKHTENCCRTSPSENAAT